MKQIVLSTHNSHKIIELSALFKSLPLPLKSLNDFPSFPPASEDGASYEENAVKKAVWSLRHLYLPCLADDSGLEVDFLKGNPGIHSARYADTNPERIERLLTELRGVPWEKRTARFVCCMALALPSEDIIIKTGYCHGYIINEERGSGGFGYDPVFFLPDFGKTMAELTFEQKNRISHRSRAAGFLIPEILQKLQ